MILSNQILNDRLLLVIISRKKKFNDMFKLELSSFFNTTRISTRINPTPLKHKLVPLTHMHVLLHDYIWEG